MLLAGSGIPPGGRSRSVAPDGGPPPRAHPPCHPDRRAADVDACCTQDRASRPAAEAAGSRYQSPLPRALGYGASSASATGARAYAHRRGRTHRATPPARRLKPRASSLKPAAAGSRMRGFLRLSHGRARPRPPPRAHARAMCSTPQHGWIAWWILPATHPFADGSHTLGDHVLRESAACRSSADARTTRA